MVTLSLVWTAKVLQGHTWRTWGFAKEQEAATHGNGRRGSVLAMGTSNMLTYWNLFPVLGTVYACVNRVGFLLIWLTSNAEKHRSKNNKSFCDFLCNAMYVSGWNFFFLRLDTLLRGRVTFTFEFCCSATAISLQRLISCFLLFVYEWVSYSLRAIQ